MATDGVGRGSGIDVVIVAFNNQATIATTIATLAQHLPGCALYLVDHAATPSTADVARQAADEAGVAAVIEGDASNPGFGAGCNRMAAKGRNPWLLFLNPDANVRSWPWAETGNIPAGAVIGANLIGTDGQEQHHYGRAWTTLSEIERGWLRRRPQLPDGHGFVSGAALLIERRVFDSIGGFDTGYFLFYEDIDLCFRAARAGARVRVEPGWRVEHLLGHSTRTDWTSALLVSLRSGRRFHARWDSRTRPYDLFMAVDGALRAAVHLALRHPDRARAHIAVTRAAARALLGRTT